MATVRMTGLTDLLGKLGKIETDMDAAGRVIVTQSAALIESAAKKNFVGSHARGEAHVGGNKPNVVTGNLRRSITHDPIERTGLGGWKTKVGPTAVYGRRVELGYTGGGGGRGQQTTRAFPFMQPAVEGAEMQLLAIALAGWARVFA